MLLVLALLAANGFVQVSPRDPRYLETSDGKPYIPNGLNLIGAKDYATWEAWTKQLAANRGNYVRLWLSNALWEVENTKAGQYDVQQVARIRQALALCNSLDIRAKLTMEHFRTIQEPGGQPWARRPMYHPDNGGLARTIAEWFDAPAPREQFRQKIRWYAEQIGDRPEVYGWELWNEVNAVKAGDYMAWTVAMLPDLHKAFPKNLAMQSLGSYDNDRVRPLNCAHVRIATNDVANVHRYLDLGADLEVCKGPVDVMAADAVREILACKPDKPVILAESGAVEPRHAGPFLLYDKDKEGMILHDVLFAPFFAGAAGSGQIWHWDRYVAQNNLWWHFARFSEAVKALDPAAEEFQPSMREEGRLRIYTLKGKRTTLVWLRDNRNTWMTELRDGQPPGLVEGVASPVKGKFRSYDPWKNQWGQGRSKLPPFRRSLVLRVEN